MKKRKKIKALHTRIIELEADNTTLRDRVDAMVYRMAKLEKVAGAQQAEARSILDWWADARAQHQPEPIADHVLGTGPSDIPKLRPGQRPPGVPNPREDRSGPPRLEDDFDPNQEPKVMSRKDERIAELEAQNQTLRNQLAEACTVASKVVEMIGEVSRMHRRFDGITDRMSGIDSRMKGHDNVARRHNDSIKALEMWRRDVDAKLEGVVCEVDVPPPPGDHMPSITCLRRKENENFID